MPTATGSPPALVTYSYTSTPWDFTGNVTASRDAMTLIAQNVMCAYPISDIYAPASRFLFYGLLVLTFASFKINWLSHVFLGAAVTYAACAAINAFILISHPSPTQAAQNVTIPFIPIGVNWTTSLTPVKAVVTNTTTISVQPDAVELDIDPILAIVVTACLVGLPLQIWSRTMRGSIIMRYMLLVWNALMLAASVCALVAWPSTNLSAPQYRFCYAGVLDSDSQNSEGWDPSYWTGSWNASVHHIFDHPGSVWQQLSDNCFYPCFNTTQVIRQSSSLKAMVATNQTNFAKLHNPSRDENDGFAGLIYIAVWAFTMAQVFLYLVTALRLGSVELRATIHEPHHLWKKKKLVWRQLVQEAKHSYYVFKTVIRLPLHLHPDIRRTGERPSLQDVLPTFRLCIDVTALLVLIAVFLLSPCIVIAFICWIEWYIRNDGQSGESINQVGQWAPLVSVAVVFLASSVYHLLKERLASPHEIRAEMESHEARLRELRAKLEKSNDEFNMEIASHDGSLSRPASENERRRFSA